MLLPIWSIWVKQCPFTKRHSILKQNLTDREAICAENAALGLKKYFRWSRTPLTECSMHWDCIGKNSVVPLICDVPLARSYPILLTQFQILVWQSRAWSCRYFDWISDLCKFWFVSSLQSFIHRLCKRQNACGNCRGKAWSRIAVSAAFLQLSFVWGNMMIMFSHCRKNQEMRPSQACCLHPSMFSEKKNTWCSFSCLDWYKSMRCINFCFAIGGGWAWSKECKQSQGRSRSCGIQTKKSAKWSDSKSASFQKIGS